MIKGYNLSSCTTYSYYTNLLLPISPLNPEDEATFSLDCSSSDHQNVEECYACVCFNDLSSTNEMVSTSKACITSQVNTTTLLLLLLSFFWTSSAIANIVHCTTAGSVGTWWFRFISLSSISIFTLYFHWFLSFKWIIVIIKLYFMISNIIDSLLLNSPPHSISTSSSQIVYDSLHRAVTTSFGIFDFDWFISFWFGLSFPQFC